MSRLSEIGDAFDQRVGWKKLLEVALDEPIPGGASWSYVFGSAALILFLVQLVTGIVLASYYSPSATDAWASIAYLEAEITFGAFVRGMHHHAASAMVIIVGVHLLQVVHHGAYRAPREANWISGLGLLGLTLAFALSGYLLPWDQTGYWATKVATSIAGTVPIVGGFLQSVAQGGNDYGNLTLTRFFAVHVIVLPLLTLGLIGAHLALFRKHGVTPHPNLEDSEKKKKRIDKFWPTQLAMDAIFAFFVISLVAFLSVVKGAPLEAPADPSSSFIARPEWYFLFLFQLLKYFEGPLQIIGTVIIPGAATTFLILLPFVDRAPSRRLRERKGILMAIGAGLLVVLALTTVAVLSDRNNPVIAEQKLNAERTARRARALAKLGVPAAGATQMMVDDPLTRGERLFARECASCHPLGGKVPEEIKGPELTGYLSKAWIRQVLRDPDSPRLFGRTKVEGMESFAHLPPKDLETLVELVYSRRDPKAASAEDKPWGALVEEHECGNCHDFEEASDYLDGPYLFGYGTPQWLLAMLKDPGQDHFYGEANGMPAFKKRLSERDLSAAVEFLLSLEGRADDEAWPFVDDPGKVPSKRIRSKPKAAGAEDEDEPAEDSSDAGAQDAGDLENPSAE